jgi:quinol monooxygenase YgiN
MSDTVSWILEMAIKPGQLDNWKALMEEMVEATQSTQPDTTIYEWFYSGDGSTCHIYERYTDSAATMVHLKAFGENFAERCLAAADPTCFTVYGNPNAEVRGALSGFGAVFMEQLGGYAR